MALDLEEQDQLDALKTWWKTNGNMVSTAVLIVAVCFSAFKGWEYYQRQQSLQASARYDEMTHLGEDEIKPIKAISGELMEKYGSTPYAARAAIAAAKANYTAKDAKSAKAQLQWAVEHAKEEAVQAIAMLQLAALQLADKEFDAALKTLSAKHDPAFDGLFADFKGDVLLAQGKKPEAKLAYEEALTKLDAQGRYHRYTEYKLETL